MKDASNKKKILHTMTWLAPGGGVDNNVFLTIKHLIHEYDFHLVTGSEIYHDNFKNIPGLKVFICKNLVRNISPIKDLKALFYFINLIRKEKYDLVHTHETKASLIGRLAAFLAGTENIIYGLHGVTFNDPLPAPLKWIYITIEKTTLWMVNLIISVSKDCLDIYHKNKIGLSIPSEVIYSGIDTEKFSNPNIPEISFTELKRTLGIEEKDTVLINIGRFSKAKAQIFTIESLVLLLKKYSDIKCIFVGEGPELENCQKKVSASGIAKKVIFYGFSDNIPLLLGVSDILVLTSLREGLPRVVVEASLCKVPSAGFEVEGIREIITDGESGFIAGSGDINELSMKIGKLIECPELRKVFSEKAFERARKGWDFNVMVEKTRNAYKSLLNRPPATHADVKEFFHNYASDFDAIYGRFEKTNFPGRFVDRHFRKVMALRMMETIKDLSGKNINSILDAGCGPGRYSVEFLLKDKKVVALDMAEGMLAIAKKATDRINRGEIEFILADYRKHTLSEKLDAACLMGFFDYIDNPDFVLEKLKSEISKIICASFPKSSGFLAWQRKIRYRLKKCPLHLYTLAEVKDLLNGAGYAGEYVIKDFGRDYYVKIDRTRTKTN